MRNGHFSQLKYACTLSSSSPPTSFQDDKSDMLLHLLPMDKTVAFTVECIVPHPSTSRLYTY